MNERNNAALEEAKKRIKDKGNGGSAPVDLSELKMQVIVPTENVKHLEEEVKKRSEEVWGLAIDYYNLSSQIKALESISDLELFPEKMKKLEELRREKVRIDRKISELPKSLGDQFAVNLFITEINNIIPTSDEEVVRYFKKILVMGRGRTPNNEEIKKIKFGKMPTSEVVYFRSADGSRHNLMHIPSKLPGREGQISGADKKLFMALRGLIQRRITARVENIEKEINDLSAKGNHDIFGIRKGVPGIYFLYIPDFKNESGVEEGRGGGLVKVYDKKGKEKRSFIVIETVKGVGSWSLLNQEKPIFIPVYYLEYFLRKERLPESAPSEFHDFILEFIVKLKRAVRWHVEKKNERK